MLKDVKFVAYIFLGPFFSFCGYLLHSGLLVWGGFALLILTTALNRLVNSE